MTGTPVTRAASQVGLLRRLRSDRGVGLGLRAGGAFRVLGSRAFGVAGFWEFWVFRGGGGFLDLGGV